MSFITIKHAVGDTVVFKHKFQNGGIDATCAVMGRIVGCLHRVKDETSQTSYEVSVSPHIPDMNIIWVDECNILGRWGTSSLGDKVIETLSAPWEEYDRYVEEAERKLAQAESM